MGLGLKNRVLDSLNTIKSTLKLGDYWYWVPSTDLPPGIPIVALVYPLRYDILIRKSFFDFYAENIQLFRHDPTAFIELAKIHDYFHWFTKVLMVRYETDSLNDQPKIHQLFTERILKAAALHDSITANGFDKRFPIIPFTGEYIQKNTSGSESHERYFMGDGCHRLACLMSQGYTTLPKDMIKVKCFKRLTPFNNTELLAGHLKINWPVEFTSRPGRSNS